MKFVSTTLIAAALLAGGVAHAGSQTYAVGTPESGLVGTSTVEFSTESSRVLYAAGGGWSRAIAPGTVTLKPNGKFVQASFPVQSITLDDGVGGPTPAEPRILALSSLGGMGMILQMDDFGEPWGEFAFTGLRADLSTKQIYATRALADGYGTGSGDLREASNVPLWNFSSVTSQLNLPLLANPISQAGVVAHIELTGLTFTPEALALLAHAEPWNSELAYSLSRLTDIGKVTTVIHAIPEPSTFVLTGLGLALMALASRRNRSGSGSLRP
jgi:hypothetical protein